ncbi:MAG: sulfatase-like hydrolase/transferase, partial [Bacteroidota bacterium]
MSITSSGYLNFPGKNNPNRVTPTGDGAAYFIWNVPSEVKKIQIGACVTVNAAFHTSADLIIQGEDRTSSIIYGTEVQDWEDNNGTGRIDDVYNYSAIQSFGGILRVENLSIVDPKAFCLRAYRMPAIVRSVNFIDTRGGEQNHSDGISAGSGSLIEDCYFETGDDNVKVYAPNMTIRDCTFNMVKNAVPIQLGWGSYTDGSSGFFTNIKVVGTSGRHSAGNAVIGSGEKGSGTVTVNIDRLFVDNPNASLINFRSPGQRLMGRINNAQIRVNQYWGPMPDGGKKANSHMIVCGERSPSEKSAHDGWQIDCAAAGAMKVMGSRVGAYELPACFRQEAAGKVLEIKKVATNAANPREPAPAHSTRSVATGAPQKPNIVFLFSDDLSFRDLSAYGQKNYQTPHLDELIQTATRFTQAYAPAPECAPSRGALLTGLHVGRGPIRTNSSARGFEALPAG